MEFDDVRRKYITLSSLELSDSPAFKHRGLSLDTSRNFVSVPILKQIIDGLGASKLNVLHWHITDTHRYLKRQFWNFFYLFIT